MDLVAGGAELRALVHRFEQGLLVKGGLGLDQLMVDRLQERVVTEGERIAGRVDQGVVPVATRAVDRGDGVTGQAGDAGLGAGVHVGIVVGVVEAAGEQGHQVVAGGAQAGDAYVAVPFQQNLAGILDAEAIGRVVEGAETVHAARVLLGDICVALAAAASPIRCSAGIGSQPGIRVQRWREGPIQRRLVIAARQMQPQRRGGEASCRRGPLQAAAPVQAGAGQPMQHEQPDDGQGRQHMDPVGARAHLRVVDLEEAEAGQQHAGGEQRDGAEIESEPGAYRVAVGAPPGAARCRAPNTRAGISSASPRARWARNMSR